MTGPIDDERSRIWLYNLYRYACQLDCERTLKQYVNKVRLLIKAIQQRIGSEEGKGILECFADSEFIQRVDIFWDDFEKICRFKHVAECSNEIDARGRMQEIEEWYTCEHWLHAGTQ